MSTHNVLFAPVRALPPAKPKTPTKLPDQSYLNLTARKINDQSIPAQTLSLNACVSPVSEDISLSTSSSKTFASDTQLIEPAEISSSSVDLSVDTNVSQEPTCEPTNSLLITSLPSTSPSDSYSKDVDNLKLEIVTPKKDTNSALEDSFLQSPNLSMTLIPHSADSSFASSCSSSPSNNSILNSPKLKKRLKSTSPNQNRPPFLVSTRPTSPLFEYQYTKPLPSRESRSKSLRKGGKSMMENAKQKLQELEALWEDDSIDRVKVGRKGRASPIEDRDAKLEPVVMVLDYLVEDELERRKIVLKEIKDLKNRIRLCCKRLNIVDDLAKYLPTSMNDVFAIKEKLSERLVELEKTISERSDIITELIKNIKAMQLYLGEDGSQQPYLDDSLDDLSEEMLNKCASYDHDLELEKQVRFHSLAQFIICIRTLYHQLHEFPSHCSESYRRALTSLFPPLDTISNPKTRTLLFRYAITSLGAATLVPIVPDKEIQLEIECLIPILSENIPEPLKLSKQCLRELYDIYESMTKEINGRMEKVIELVKEIGMFWEQLNVPEEERIPLVCELKNFVEYKTLRDKLQVVWKSKMEDEVNKLLEELKRLWDLCGIEEDERNEIIDRVNENLYSPVTVELFQQQIEKYRLLWEKRKDILDMIEERKQFILKIIEFEKSASDPRRLFKSSFQLNEEERFRKTCVPTLLKMEEILKKAVIDYENETGRAVVVDGFRFLDTLEREISERFINNTVMLVDQPITLTSDQFFESKQNSSLSSRSKSRSPDKSANTNRDAKQQSLRRSRSSIDRSSSSEDKPHKQPTLKKPRSVQNFSNNKAPENVRDIKDVQSERRQRPPSVSRPQTSLGFLSLNDRKTEHTKAPVQQEVKRTRPSSLARNKSKAAEDKNEQSSAILPEQPTKGPEVNRRSSSIQRKISAVFSPIAGQSSESKTAGEVEQSTNESEVKRRPSTIRRKLSAVFSSSTPQSSESKPENQDVSSTNDQKVGRRNSIQRKISAVFTPSGSNITPLASGRRIPSVFTSTPVSETVEVEESTDRGRKRRNPLGWSAKGSRK